MFPVLKVLLTLAMSKQGRRALRSLVDYLRSDDGQKTLAYARRVATGPEAQQIAKQVVSVVKQAGARARIGRAPAPPPVPRSRLAGLAASGRRAGVHAADRAWQRARSVRMPGGR